MRKDRINKAFTLIELVIVLIVVALLMGVLFQVYITIAKVSVRIRLEKQVGLKVVHMQTLLQNITDTNTIDYSRLSPYDWRALTTLPLINVQWQTWSLSINTTWELIYTLMSGDQEQIVSLLGDEIFLQSGAFVVTPLRDPDWTPPGDKNPQEAFMEIQQPWYRLFGYLSPVFIEPKIQFPIQTFYTIIQK